MLLYMTVMTSVSFLAVRVLECNGYGVGMLNGHGVRKIVGYGVCVCVWRGLRLSA
jgi:hypothetical protein